MQGRHAMLLGVLHACVADAAVRPASIFTDHMVLQRDAAIPAWGAATPGSTVIVGFGDQQPTGVAQPDGTWKVCSPESVPSASAVGFYFSLEVMRDQKVPVGFIQAAIGGSRIEPWLTERAFAECDAIKDELPTWTSMENVGERVGFCYERVIERWTRFPIKGILWYQGESNVAKGDTPARYAAKMKLLIESWRAAWGGALQLARDRETQPVQPRRLARLTILDRARAR